MIFMMKKLLGILVICSLLGGNANANSSNLSTAPIGTSAKEACGYKYFCYKNTIASIYYPEFKTEIWYASKDRDYFYVFHNVNKATKFSRLNFRHKFYGLNNDKYGGTYVGYYASLENAKVAADPKLFEKKQEEIRIAEEKKKEEKKITEKTKKKKPKQLPEDNKVVPAGSGSGFFVSNEGHVITNHHVIDGCNTTKVSFKGNQVDAQILAVDKMNDIAILKTNIKPNSIFPISNEDVSLLEDVVVAGYPLGKQVSSAIKTHKGVVTALAGAGDNYSNFQTDASINAGNSGGPIMNQKGNIVGIAVATWVEEGVQGVHFGIKSSTLKTFASSNSLKFSQANNRELSNKDLGKLITEATVYLECHMTVAKIKRMIAEANNQKAFFSEFK